MDSRKLKQNQTRIKIRMKNKSIWLVLGIALFLQSCGDSDQIFDVYKTVPDRWGKNEAISFEVTPPDSTNTYNVFINVRNTNDYEFSNLYLIVDMNFPHGKTITDTLEYQMAAPDGKLLGTGITDVKENKLWYKEALIFNESGDYKFTVQQAMRKNGVIDGEDQLKGITDIGLLIEPVLN